MASVVVLEYGVGNIGSILNILKKVGAQAKASSKPEDILAAERLVLPGIGAFDNGMRKLEESGLIPALKTRVLEDRTPILGICLGMQLFTKRSDEGSSVGLGWVDAETVKFKAPAGDESFKIPHMGWNEVAIRSASAAAPLFEGMDEEKRFYFVHSYYVRCAREQDVLTTTHYGTDFASAYQSGNIVGVQFHPEKSHRYGMQLFRNFVKWSPPAVG
jgi:imidazole glycerol-phosphate synthase subunit HisH